MPPVAPARTGPPEPSRYPRSELQDPAPHSLIREVEPTFSEEILNVSVAQRETEVEPNRVLDDRRRKAMPAIGEMGHARTLSDQLLAGDPRCRDNAGGALGLLRLASWGVGLD